MDKQRYVITGGCGFIGSYLVKKLVSDGNQITVIDNLARGDAGRLYSVKDKIDLVTADIRCTDELVEIFKWHDVVFHLAAINGTENFYKHPDLVLDTGVKGALAVVEACIASGVTNLVMASSAEVYQTADIIPTNESVCLKIPDSLNPRYSYGASKIISEIIAFNYGREHFQKVQVFRPHNVYGPDMGWKHVIPQLINRALSIDTNQYEGDIPFSILGDGSETRAFCYVDDIVDGILKMYKLGGNREIYHIGNDHEITISELVKIIGDILGLSFCIQPSNNLQGSTTRRCPDISKMKKLGYAPSVNIYDGIEVTAQWYKKHFEAVYENQLL